MRTKLVYVLTCDENATYIEQALLSIYTARYYNPDATIVLLTDDKTDKLLTGNRGLVLQYVSEKIVIPFEDSSLTPLYRSRWLKTSCRRLVRGSLLYIDCDTIVMKSLTPIDDIEGDVAMVHDAHMVVEEYTKQMFELSIENCAKIGFDAKQERCYYNGGVIFVKDTDKGNKLFEAWHNEWKRGTEINFYGDEPSLMKVNNALGHIVTELSGAWNCQVFMNPLFIYEAFITHYWWVPRKRQSFIFTPQFQKKVQENGLTEYVKLCALHPINSMLPGNNHMSHFLWQDFWNMTKTLSHELEMYAVYIDPSFADFPWLRNMNRQERAAFTQKRFKCCMRLYALRQYVKLRVFHQGYSEEDILCTL